MNQTVSDVGLKTILEDQLKRANAEGLILKPAQDWKIGEHTLPVFFGLLNVEHGPIDAWVITAGGSTGYYNREHYPDMYDAVAQHIGRLVLDNKLKAVDMADGTVKQQRRRRRKPDEVRAEQTDHSHL